MINILEISSGIFFLGLFGVILNRKNILTTIIAIELLLLAINCNFAVFSVYLNDITGQIFIVFILTIAAAESAIGLAIITAFYKLRDTIEMVKISKIDEQGESKM